jgi:hypothetical protein
MDENTKVINLTGPKLDKDHLNSLTNVPLTIAKGTRPLLRFVNRWEYLKEYIYDFYLTGKRSQLYEIATLVFGVMALPVFAPGALILLAMAGRNHSRAWYCNFVVNIFGKNRTLIYAT